jgi:hypothetical protein
MTSKSTHRLASVVAGILVGGGIYRLVSDLGIASATGVTWGMSLLLIFPMSRLYPSHTSGTAWRDKHDGRASALVS